MKIAILMVTAVVLTGCSTLCPHKPRVTCDFNMSGSVDASDLAAQRAAFNTVDELYDVTGEGIVTGADISACQQAFSAAQ